MPTPVRVISKDNKPLMPTNRFGKVRHMLRQGRARVVNKDPFTIKLTYVTTAYTQPTDERKESPHGEH